MANSSIARPVAIGKNLRSARRHLRLSQTSVAEFTGTTRQTVASFEKDQRAPDVAQLVRMANLFRLTLDELIGGARSAVAPPGAVPSLLPRLNKTKGLDEQDVRELQEFDAYLSRRPEVDAPTFKSGALETVRDTVLRLGDAFGAKGTAPVPVFALISKMGIELRFTGMGELAGALLLPQQGRPAGILVNSDQPFERQRFSAAHELGHFVLNHQPPPGGTFVSFLGRRFDPVEVDADTFAAELLTPTELLMVKLTEVAERPVEEAVYLLSQTFAVSFQAMTLRLSKLGALRPEQTMKLEATKPGEIAKKVSSQGHKTSFDPTWLPRIAKQSLPGGWSEQAGPDTVRALQESAYLHYLTKVPEGGAADSAGGVYEHVARWVATEYPVIQAS